MPTAIVVGIGSDIGRELAVRFAGDGWDIAGTYRSAGGLEGLPRAARLFHCDLLSKDSIATVARQMIEARIVWDALVLAAGTEEPIGEFWECDADAWEDGIRLNALSLLRFVRLVYPSRSQASRPSVAFFSGSGTNSAAPAYSAYCASKILLIKMCELLDAESPDTSFFIIGPGIVRTKIHEQTLRAGPAGGQNLAKVVRFLESEDPGTSHDDIYACIQWAMKAGKAAMGGRNISLVHDAWRGGGELAQWLESDANRYKLRRFGNEIRVGIHSV